MSVSPRNILWLVSDHQLYANHGRAIRRLPLQVKLAKEGVSFSRAYTPLPICSPARASMLTGLYPHAHGLTENDGRFGGRSGLGASDWMVHQPFLESNYRCGWFGKWHLDNQRSALDYGFEGFSLPGYGYPYGTDQYRDYLERTGADRPVAEVEIPGESGTPVGTRIDLTKRNAWLDYESGAARLLSQKETHEAFFLVDEARQWLESIDDQPFFMRVDTWGPHPPYLVPKELQDFGGCVLSPNYDSDLASRPGHHRTYRDSWTETLGLDRNGWERMTTRAYQQATLVEMAFCSLLDALETLGLAENTIVIFTADHGDAIGSNGGTCNKGGLMVEETMQIPLCFRGPDIPTGEARSPLVSSMDIAPTLLDWCGLNAGHAMHGDSLLTSIRGNSKISRRGLLTEHYGLHEPIAQRGFYQDNWKLVVQEDGFVEFYDLNEDPAEMNNLARSPQHRRQMESVWQGLAEAMVDTDDNDPRLSWIKKGVPDQASRIV